MASPSRPHRVSIGFHGGQVLSLRLADSDLAGLRRALELGGWHELVAEDGTIQLHLEQVVYVRVETDDQRVGFGA